MKEITLQQSLGEFLRTAREHLTPELVGLPSHGRRRTPGLRREAFNFTPAVLFIFLTCKSLNKIRKEISFTI
jgi:hypothetical protein